MQDDSPVQGRLRPQLGLNRATVFAATTIAIFLCGLFVRYLAYANWTSSPSLGGFVLAHCQWDCGWYSSLIHTGYDTTPQRGVAANSANWPFFPLYPALAFLFSKIVDTPPALTGFLLSNIFSLLSTAVAFQLFRNNLRSYSIFLAMLFCGPFSVYFSTLYTESLFLLLVLVGILAVRRRQFVLAGLIGALISATRPVGIFFFVYLLLEIWIHERNSKNILSFIVDILGHPALLTALALPPLGLALYMNYLYFHTGDALAFAHIEVAWGRALGDPLAVLWTALTSADYRRLNTPFSYDQYLAIFSIAGIVISVLMINEKKIPEGVFSLLCLLLPLSTSVMSMPRYTIGIAPILLWISNALGGPRVFVPAMIICFVLCYQFSALWFVSSRIMF